MIQTAQNARLDGVCSTKSPRKPQAKATTDADIALKRYLPGFLRGGRLKLNKTGFKSVYKPRNQRQY